MSYSAQSRGPPPIEGMYSLKVDNLTYRTSPETLRRQFDKFGEVGDIYIPRDRYTKESRGFAFIRYYDKRDAEDAMDGMDGKMMDGRELRVQMASKNYQTRSELAQPFTTRNRTGQRYGRPSEPPQRRHGGSRYGGGGGNYGGGGGGGYRGGGGRHDGRYDRRSPRRRSYSRSRSRSRSRERRHKSYSRSRSRSRSRSKSPADEQNAKSRSRSKSRSASPEEKND